MRTHDSSASSPYSIPPFTITAVTSAMAREHRDWAIQQLGFDKTPYRGKGQRVGVVDTGCDINHQDLKGRVTAGAFIAGNKTKPAWKDECGHATFCVGEIVARQDGQGVVGAAPEATAYAARVLYGDQRDMRRNDIDRSIGLAVDACVKEGCGVISMSLGGPMKSGAIATAVTKAVDAGVIVVAAAGNERLDGSPYKSYPAALLNVVSVAAANKKGMPAWFSTMGRGSNRLEQPEIAVKSLEYYWGCLPGNNYGRMIGTSMSTPLVAAAALLWREALVLKNALPKGPAVLEAFRAWLQRCAVDTNKNGWDPELGYGVLLFGAP
jgi:major intracellular serine protease